MEEKKKLSGVVKYSRELMGLSQRELARRTGIDNAEISRIEKGTRKQPGFFVLRGLAKELNVDINYLMELAEYDEEELEYFSNYQDLPPMPEITWDKYHQYSKLCKDGYKLNILKVIRGFKDGYFSENDFIYLLSKGLGIQIRDYIFEEEKKTISCEKDNNK